MFKCTNYKPFHSQSDLISSPVFSNASHGSRQMEVMVVAHHFWLGFVADRPDAASKVQIYKCQDGNATIVWMPGSYNNAPVQYYILQYNTSFNPDTWTFAVRVSTVSIFLNWTDPPPPPPPTHTRTSLLSVIDFCSIRCSTFDFFCAFFGSVLLSNRAQEVTLGVTMMSSVCLHACILTHF